MDMWKPFRKVTAHRAPKAAILFDKFHVVRHLGEALDGVRKSEYARRCGRQRRYIKGHKYTLLSKSHPPSLAKLMKGARGVVDSGMPTKS